MLICIYDAKVRHDEVTARYLNNAIANIYFLLLSWNSSEGTVIIIICVGKLK